MCTSTEPRLPAITYDPCDDINCQRSEDGHGYLRDENGKVIKAVCSRETGRVITALVMGPDYEKLPQCSLALTLLGNQPLAESDETANPEVLLGTNNYNDFLAAVRNTGEEEGSIDEIPGLTAHDFILEAKNRGTVTVY